ncbi:MAG TPA: hypothetical protein VMZ00_16950 [Sporichthya sp.]|nr:hypothetical protein [Sporichthya sp.]
MIAGLALLALAGCNGGVAGLTAQSASGLHERVAAVRAAADTEDRAGAMAAVDAFRAEVGRLVASGELTQAQAAGLLAYADKIAGGVLAEVVAPSPTPTPTPSAEPTVTPEPTMSPDQVELLRQETADRLTEILRERLTEYVKQQIAERQAEQKAAQERKKAQRKQRATDGRGGSGAH